MLPSRSSSVAAPSRYGQPGCGPSGGSRGQEPWRRWRWRAVDPRRVSASVGDQARSRARSPGCDDRSRGSAILAMLDRGDHGDRQVLDAIGGDSACRHVSHGLAVERERDTRLVAIVIGISKPSKHQRVCADRRRPIRRRPPLRPAQRPSPRPVG